MDISVKQETSSNGSTKRKPEIKEEEDEMEYTEEDQKSSIKSRLGPRVTDVTKRKPEIKEEADEMEYLENEQKPSVKSRLGPKVSDDEESDDSRDNKPRSSPRKMPKKELETDPAVIAKREKQIEYGKNTNGYENYIKTVPKSERKQDDPRTPPKYGKYSRRAWDGLIKQWRIKLHKYDVEEQ